MALSVWTGSEWPQVRGQWVYTTEGWRPVRTAWVWDETGWHLFWQLEPPVLTTEESATG